MGTLTVVENIFVILENNQVYIAMSKNTKCKHVKHVDKNFIPAEIMSTMAH